MANLNDRVTELEHQVAALTSLVETLLARPHLPVERKRQDDFDPFPRFSNYDTHVGDRLPNPLDIMCEAERKHPDEFRKKGMM